MSSIEQLGGQHSCEQLEAIVKERMQRFDVLHTWASEIGALAPIDMSEQLETAGSSSCDATPMMQAQVGNVKKGDVKKHRRRAKSAPELPRPHGEPKTSPVCNCGACCDCWARCDQEIDDLIEEAIGDISAGEDNDPDEPLVKRKKAIVE